MKICAIQIPYVKKSGDVARSVDILLDELNRCDQSCDIILTPEYSNAPGGFATGECIVFAQKQTPRLIAAARAAAVRCQAIVAVNYVCEAEKGLFRNTTEVFDPQGNSAGRFFKQHLPRAEKNINLLDEEYTRKFRRPTIVEVNGIRLGFLICYDTYFSEYVAHLAHCKPDLVMVSSFQRAERKDILRMMNVHLAFNCNAYVLRASVSMGVDSLLGGNSMVVAPDGTILGEFANQVGRLDCQIDDIKYKYMRSNSFGGSLIPNEQFVEQARATWAYRPCGSMTVEGDRKMDYPRLCARGGLNAAAPASSLPALGAAIALGAKEVFIAVHFTRDEVPVVVADGELENISDGRGHVEDYTLMELKKLDSGSQFGNKFAHLPFPTLEEVLSKFARHAVINLYLSESECEDFRPSPDYPPERMQKIVDLLECYDQQEHVYFTGSVNVMKTALTVAPSIPRCITVTNQNPDPVGQALKFGCEKIQFQLPVGDYEVFARAHAQAIKCVADCCDDPEEIRKLLEAGADTVVTNDYWRMTDAVGIQ